MLIYTNISLTYSYILIDGQVDLRDSKIVALAKKSHKLTMLLNKEKALTDRLALDNEDLRRQVESLTQEIALSKTQSDLSNKAGAKTYNRHALANQSKKDEDEQNVLQLQRNLRDAQRTIDDLKTKVRDLTEENKALSKVLTKELGDGVALEQAVDAGWRGRAQQIILLKAKIKQLESASQNNSVVLSNGASAFSSATKDVDVKASEDLVEMSRERRQVVEALTEERVKLVEQNQQLEKKVTGYKARIQILEGDVRKMKESLQVSVDLISVLLLFY